MKTFNGQSVPSNVVFTITDKCNLSCKYCYTRFEDFKPVGPDIKVCKALVDFVLAQSNVRGDQASIHFFGGEPLTAIEELKETMLYGNSRGKIRWSITTNATLLTPQTYNWLVNNGLSDILFSIDGPEHVHNINRVDECNKGSFSKAIENIQQIPDLSRYGCRGTFNQETVQYLSESYIYLHSLGFGNCTILPTHEGEWSEEHLRILEDQLTEFAVWWINEAMNGRFHEIHQFSEGLRFLLSTEKVTRPCGLGDRALGVTPTGVFVPCHRFGTRREIPAQWILGNVFDGIDEERFMKSIEWDNSKRHSAAGYNCNLCPANDQCTGSCIAANWDCAGMPNSTEERYHVAKSVCDFSLINFRIACLIYRILRDNKGFQDWISKRIKGGIMPYYDPRKKNGQKKCDRCLECQVCYTAQDQCLECQVCYTAQKTPRCIECQVCYTSQDVIKCETTQTRSGNGR